MIRAQPGELAPMTAAWSSAVHVRPFAAANADRTSSHQISESTMTPSMSKITASIRRAILSAAVEPAAWSAAPARARCAGGLRRSSALGGRLGPSGDRRGPAIDRREEGLGEDRDRIASRIGAVEHVRLDLERHQAVAALDLDRELAELDALPAHDLATRARAFARDRRRGR